MTSQTARYTGHTVKVFNSFAMAGLLGGGGLAAAQNAQSAPPASAAAPALPGWVQRGLPGPHHRALDALAGQWSVWMGLYGTLGRDPNAPPLVSDKLRTRREWVAGGRYLEDTTEGELEGFSYWRRGWLGYSNMDQGYEWVTIDGSNANMMSYTSARVAVPTPTIVLTGEFTDQGVTGEKNAGRRVPMRTVIRIENNNRHVIELYFTAPGQPEVLATRAIYTRVAP